MSKNSYTVITFGTYDLFHLGHLRIIERAREIADREGAQRGVPGLVVVGVSSDKLTQHKKLHLPVVPESERLQIISALKAVDDCFLEESLGLKCTYIQEYNADCLVMGDDHTDRFVEVESFGCTRVFLPRTSDISTTERLQSIRGEIKNKVQQIVRQSHEAEIYQPVRRKDDANHQQLSMK